MSADLIAFLKSIMKRATPVSLAHPHDAAAATCPRCETEVHARRTVTFKCRCGSIQLQIDLTDTKEHDAALRFHEANPRARTHEPDQAWLRDGR